MLKIIKFETEELNGLLETIMSCTKNGEFSGGDFHRIVNTFFHSRYKTYAKFTSWPCGELPDNSISYISAYEGDIEHVITFKEILNELLLRKQVTRISTNPIMYKLNIENNEN